MPDGSVKSKNKSLETNLKFKLVVNDLRLDFTLPSGIIISI